MPNNFSLFFANDILYVALLVLDCESLIFVLSVDFRAISLSPAERYRGPMDKKKKGKRGGSKKTRTKAEQV